ncbi:hypothetical protein BWR18_18770 [Tateyamaria omphalii]|uniref:Uncharacterized protein n=1 Tax=Tateyamaria omphalii TaxID=299262 RepID=A0A1P8MZK4_9RHOB|nr:hypothetical protein BWR18_18770 [Tateyamaria omphalii]
MRLPWKLSIDCVYAAAWNVLFCVSFASEMSGFGLSPCLAAYRLDQGLLPPPHDPGRIGGQHVIPEFRSVGGDDDQKNLADLFPSPEFARWPRSGKSRV